MRASVTEFGDMDMGAQYFNRAGNVAVFVKALRNIWLERLGDGVEPGDVRL